MEYNLLICTSTTKWIAIDINPHGELDRISLDGNDFEEVCSIENVLEFCTKILGYYNGYSEKVRSVLTINKETK